MENTHTTESKELSTGFYIAIYLLLLLILAIFGDLLVFIVGTIGVSVAFAAYFSSKSSADDHH
jgi:hypothetical protein